MADPFLRFYIDPDSGEPHIFEHGVSEAEVGEVLNRPQETLRGRKESSVAHGRTKAGRYLKVIFSPDDDGESIFVITAFDLPAKQIAALKRRLRRK